MDKSRLGPGLALAVALAACSGDDGAPPTRVAAGGDGSGAAAALDRFAPDPADPYTGPEAKFEVRVETDVMVPMRDGVRLATDLYLPVDPADRGDRLPVVMIRLPYDKATYRAGAISPARFFAGQGYAVVVQDVRGKYASEGDYLLSAAGPGGRVRCRRVGLDRALVEREGGNLRLLLPGGEPDPTHDPAPPGPRRRHPIGCGAGRSDRPADATATSASSRAARSGSPRVSAGSAATDESGREASRRPRWRRSPPSANFPRSTSCGSTVPPTGTRTGKKS